jgi:hypothetical protein
MQINNSFLTKTPHIAIYGLFVVLASCGSSQYASQDNDGIYSSDKTVEYQENTVTVTEKESSSQTFYKNYFKEKSLEYQLPEEENEEEIFTDVDSYEGEYAVAQDTTNVEYESYAGWGEENSNVTVSFNVGLGYGWGYSPWYSPYYYGGYYPYYGYGWGYYNPWFPPYPYYGGGYYGGGYYGGGYYGGGYYAYGGRGVSYSSGRRGTSYAGNYYNDRSSSYYGSRTRNTGANLGYTNPRTRDNSAVQTRSRNTSTVNPNTSVRPTTRGNSTVRPNTNTVTPRTTTKPESSSLTTPRSGTKTRSNNTSSPRSNNSATPRRSSGSSPSYSPRSSGSSGSSGSFGGGGRSSGGSRGRG